MPTTSLTEALFPRSRSAILSALTAAGDEGLHLREVARRTELNSKTVMRQLHALRDAGILTSRDVGRQVIYRLNPNYPIVDELRSTIRKTVGLAGVLSAALAPFADRIDQAYVYGSHARGEERADGDVDLMMTGSVSLRELSPALRDLRNKDIYTGSSHVSAGQALEAVEEARGLTADTRRWLESRGSRTAG